MTGAIQKILFLMVKISDTLKLLTMCMKSDFLSTLLKEPDDFSEYIKFLVNYQG